MGSFQLPREVKKRSLTNDVPETLPPLCIPNRIGPKFPENAATIPPIDLGKEFTKCLHVYYIWFFSRIHSSTSKQLVSGFGGFISAKGVTPKRKTTIEYYTPIQQPITRYETVKELLKQSEEATDMVGQVYTVNTFDLGVCMKSLPIICK